MNTSSRRELWDSHKKFRRKVQDRGVCLLGEWVSLITVPRRRLPTPFLDNKTLPASFHSNSLLCLGRHAALGCTQPSMNDAACLMDYTCPFRVSRVQNALIFTIATLTEDHSSRSFSRPPKKAILSSLLGVFAYSFESKSWSVSVRWFRVLLKAM